MTEGGESARRERDTHRVRGKAKGPVDPAALKRRALRMLSQREHSRAELRRKLLGTSREADDAVRVDALLDSLAADDWLSDQRFAEGFVRSRAARHGGARIERELQAKGIGRELAAEYLLPLRAAELNRAFELWQRRFGRQPQDQAERGRQGRFLIQRGFSPSTVRQVFDRARNEHDDGPSANTHVAMRDNIRDP